MLYLNRTYPPSDLHLPGFRDPANPNIRYKLPPPTNSNLHNDLIHIHRTNVDYHRSQREIEEHQQTTTGTHPDNWPLTSYIDTPPAAANVSDTIDRYQCDRYQRRRRPLILRRPSLLLHVQ